MAPTQQHQPLGSEGTGNKSKDLAQVTALLTEGAKKKKKLTDPLSDVMDELSSSTASVLNKK